MQDDSALLQGLQEDFEYVLHESGFVRKSRRHSSRLFLCDSSPKRELLAGQLCQHIRHQHPEVPVVFFDISARQSPGEVIRHIAAILHVASKEHLGKSFLEGTAPSNLTTLDLKLLITETVKGFDQSFRSERQPAFVLVVSDVTNTQSTLSVLNFLRATVSEGGNIAWIVFSPRAVLDVYDPSGASPFYNIFPIRDIRTKFAEIPNPYICGRPIKHKEMLFGRTPIITAVQRDILHGSRPIALWGPRRIGKTSVLFALRNTLRAYCLPVYFDCQCVAVGARHIGLFFTLLGLEILEQEMMEFGDGESLNRTGQGISFSELMGIVSRVEQRRHCKVVCLLDEIECLERSVEDGLTALQQLADAGVVRLIVGALGLKKLLSDSTSPIFGTFTGQKLGCLERNAAIELITHPVENTMSYEPEAIDEILRVVGTHPLLVQMLCSWVVDILNDKGSTKATGKNIRRAYREFIEVGYARPMSAYLSRVLDPLCLDLLGAFVHIQSQAARTALGKGEFMQYIMKRDGAPGEIVDLHDRVEKAIEALCDQEIVESLDDQYRLKAQCYIDSLARP